MLNKWEKKVVSRFLELVMMFFDMFNEERRGQEQEYKKKNSSTCHL